MKYRRLSPTGDYIFGFGNTSFLTDTDAVAQAINTKLKLFQGEFWENTGEGLPFFQQIAGQQISAEEINLLIQERILQVPNVTEIISLSGQIDKTSRKYSASITVRTSFGTTVEVNI